MSDDTKDTLPSEAGQGEFRTDRIDVGGDFSTDPITSMTPDAVVENEVLDDADDFVDASNEFEELVADEITVDAPASVRPRELPPGWAKIEGGGRGGDGDRPQPELVAETPRLGPPPDLRAVPYVEPKLDPEYAKRYYPPVSIPDTLFDTDLKEDMWPQEGFLATYVSWMEASTDAPRPFHVAAGLVALATAIGDRFRVESRSAKGMAANLFCLLIGDSGIRKSTAMEPVIDLLTKANGIIAGHVKSDLALITLVQKANNVPQAWIIDEAADLLEMTRGKFGREIQTALNKLYDGRELTYSSFTQKNTIYASGFVSLLTASPLPWLRECRLSTEFLQGGLFSRFIVIPAAAVRELKTDPRRPDPQIREALSLWLDQITKITGSTIISLAPDATQELQAWLKNRGKVPEVATGVWHRADIIVRKIALLYHIAQGFGTNPINADTVLQAIRFVHYFVLPGHLWATLRLPEIPAFAKVMQAVEEKANFTPAGIKFTEAAYDFNCSTKFICEVLWTLYRAQRIQLYIWKPGTRGRPVYLIGKYGVTPAREGVVLVAEQLPMAMEKYGTIIGDVATGFQATTDSEEATVYDDYEPEDDPNVQYDDDPVVLEQTFADHDTGTDDDS